MEKLQQQNDQANRLLVGLSQYLQENGLFEKTSASTKAGTSRQPTPKQVKTYSQHEVIQEMPPRASPQPRVEEGNNVRDEVREQMYQHFQTIGIGLAPPKRNVEKPFPAYVYEEPFPPHYISPNLTNFTGENSPITPDEHIAVGTLSCSCNSLPFW